MKKYIFGLAVLTLVTTGCEKQYLADDGYTPEEYTVDITENKKINFFGTSENFGLSESTVQQIENLLKETRSKGIENISFMLVSDKPVPANVYQATREKMLGLMRRHGFLESRIVDSGMCVYSDAKRGVRIDVLQYDVQEPDCSQWSEYIGDTDTNKNLPKYGVSEIYNLEQMIANKADLIAPRTYKGQRTQDAITAAGLSAGGSSTPGSSSSSSSSSSGSSSGSSGSSSSSSTVK